MQLKQRLEQRIYICKSNINIKGQNFYVLISCVLQQIYIIQYMKLCHFHQIVEECKELTNLAERNKLVSSKWASLTQEEKESYKGANVREVDIANLDDAAKENLKKKYVKQLQSIVSIYLHVYHSLYKQLIISKCF